MASPQLENGYTMIANEILEALAKSTLTSAQLKIVIFIIRKTYGWVDGEGQKKKTDHISCSQIAKGTGLSNGTIRNQLVKLYRMKVITKEREFNGEVCEIGLQKDYERWSKMSPTSYRVSPTDDRGCHQPVTHKRNLKENTTTKEVDPWVVVLNYYEEVTNRIQSSPVDVQLAKEAIVTANGSIETVKLGIDKGLESFKKSHPGGSPSDIKGFRYFVGAIKDEIALSKATAEPAKPWEPSGQPQQPSKPRYRDAAEILKERGL